MGQRRSVKLAISLHGSPDATGPAPRPAEPGTCQQSLQALLRGAGRAFKAPPPAPSSARDVGDAAQAAEEELVRVATIRQRRQTVAEVREALRLLRAGRYGICAECEEPIPAERLRALPFAVRCRPCQERIERRPVGLDQRALARRLSLLKAAGARLQLRRALGGFRPETR